MRAIKVDGNVPVFTQVPEPTGEGVRVKVVSASICGSDLHMLERGYFGEQIIGHEFAGFAPDGTAVAVEPTVGCGHCSPCGEGYNSHCEAGVNIMGVMADGGMAEYALVPARNLVPLPTGLDLPVACLVEPLAVALHGLDRARVASGDRVLVVGAGPVGLALGAALRHRGMHFDIIARYEHQRAAAEALGAGLRFEGHYDVVLDAIGTSESLEQALVSVRPLGRIGMLGSFWSPVVMGVEFCLKEVELIGSTTYTCKSPHRNFEEAGRLLSEDPAVARLLITHRFPLEAVDEAFAAAADRAGGAIKVVFEL